MDTRPEFPDPSQTSTAAAASPPSLTSSPSHEFSFTISLHSTAALPLPDKSRAPPPSSAGALDLSPADDIFSHGHLLPLHLLSHPPAASPRSSTTSLDGLSLPIRNVSQDSKTPIRIQTHPANNTADVETEEGRKTKPNTNNTDSNSKSLFFGLLWRKASDRENKDGDEKEKKLKKLMSTDFGRAVKRYARMVRPLLPIGRRRRQREEEQIQRQSYSFSGNLLGRGIRREEFSAPASMRASPTNSGLLLAKATLPSPASDSTMEELQAAIQAAIAHCKNSIAHPDDKVIC